MNCAVLPDIFDPHDQFILSYSLLFSSSNSNYKPISIVIILEIYVRIFFQGPDDATADAAVR